MNVIVKFRHGQKVRIFKDFYISCLCIATTFSTCGSINPDPNISRTHAKSNFLHPFSALYKKPFFTSKSTSISYWISQSPSCAYIFLPIEIDTFLFHIHLLEQSLFYQPSLKPPLFSYFFFYLFSQLILLFVNHTYQ